MHSRSRIILWWNPDLSFSSTLSQYLSIVVLCSSKATHPNSIALTAEYSPRGIPESRGGVEEEVSAILDESEFSEVDDGSMETLIAPGVQPEEETELATEPTVEASGAIVERGFRSQIRKGVKKSAALQKTGKRRLAN